MNIARVMFAFFIPGFVFFFLFNLFDFDAEPFIFLTAFLSGMFATEVMARQMDEQRIWAVISKSVKDKIAFASGLILFGVFSASPEYFGVGSRWISLFIMLVGLFTMFAVVKLFGSKELSDALIKPRKKIKTDSSMFSDEKPHPQDDDQRIGSG